MKRLLCILSNMNVGGAETFLMKLYRMIDRSKYQMDFCINAKEKCDYEEEILKLGGKVYRIPSKSDNRIEFKKQLTAIIHNSGYQNVIRITSNAAGFMDLAIAKKAGARICIARSSNSSDGGGIKPFIVHRLGRMIYGHYVDIRIAPSDLAAKYTFGKNVWNRNGVKILHNGLDLKTYRYNLNDRLLIRKEFGILDTSFVIGHIGRFNEQKNHSFLIDVFYEISKMKPNSVLMLVGVGVLENKIKEKILKLGLEKQVIFTGLRMDIPKILSSMDVFVFPSFYEGMPNTILEAQASGLPCVISDTITKEANVTGEIHYFSLKKSAEEWAKEALSLYNQTDRKTGNMKMQEADYDIHEVVKQFVDLVYQ